MKPEAVQNQRKRRKMRAIAKRFVVEYAPYIITMSRKPSSQDTTTSGKNYGRKLKKKT